MPTVSEAISFKASFPSIQTAIKVDGDGGMRIQLDIPESEMAQAVQLLALRQTVLKVTVEADQQGVIGGGGTRTVKRSAAKRRE